jgi:hypothetical protein
MTVLRKFECHGFLAIGSTLPPAQCRVRILAGANRRRAGGCRQSLLDALADAGRVRADPM